MIQFFYDKMYRAKSHNNRVSFKLWYRMSDKLLNMFYEKVMEKVPFNTGIDKFGINQDIIISLTSFSKRLNVLPLTIKTLLHQTYKVDKVLLTLSNEEFKSEDQLPNELLKLKQYGLEIIFRPDLKSHNKYYYAMQEHPNSTIVTVDDDMFYPENLVEELVKHHMKYPDAICCTRAHEITFDNFGAVQPYSKWNGEVRGYFEPSLLICQTGTEGVLYPPHSLVNKAFDAKQIKTLCPKADDIWLKCMSIKNGVKVVTYRDYVIPFIEISDSQEVTLRSTNIGKNENDIQLKRVIDTYPEVMEALEKEIR